MTLITCLFALRRSLTFRLLSVSICVNLWLLFIGSYFSSVSYASSPLANDVHFCQVFDYEDIRARDNLYAATKKSLNLNVGKSRTVRMIYFLPNDRPFQREVVDWMKVTIRQVQTFYAEQMEAHGYGNKSFRFETDAKGEPVVRLVDGQHSDSYYLDNTMVTVFDEIGQAFDIWKNIYFIAIDNSINGIGRGGRRVAAAVGSPRGKNGGLALVPGGFSWKIVAHELGHVFGLQHDFRDGAYIMSYGRRRDRLSACATEFLTVHTYFNASIPLERGKPPTIDLISPIGYTAAKSIPVKLSVHDGDGLHQVSLMVRTRRPNGTAGPAQMKACRGLPDQYDYNAVVKFDYDGVIPSDNFSSLWNPDTHPISIRAVDAKGNVSGKSFELICENCPLMLVKNSGDNQQGAPNMLLPNPLIIEVQDKNGAVVEGIPVTFAVTEGDGTLSVKTATTDLRGHAQTMLTLGNSLETITVIAAVAGIEQPETFVIDVMATPDFDGDGNVGIPDFLQFVERFGFSRGDERYEARFDLDGDGVIGIGDFLIFVDNFGKKVS